MTRIKYYRFIGTAGVALMIAGMFLLTTVTVSSQQFEVTRDLVVVGLGLGATFPLYLTVLQSALPRRYLGVASSQIQFWRNVGGTVSTAIMGSILARLLPDKISGQIDSLRLPAAVAGRFKNFSGGSGGGSPQQIFDPAKLAQTRAGLPSTLQPVFDQVMHAVRIGLSQALHDLFLYSALVLVLALVATVFLKEVPLRRAERGAGAGLGEPPPVALETEEEASSRRCRCGVPSGAPAPAWASPRRWPWRPKRRSPEDPSGVRRQEPIGIHRPAPEVPRPSGRLELPDGLQAPGAGLRFGPGRAHRGAGFRRQR